MLEAVLALSIASALMLTAIIVGFVKIYRMNEHLETLARSLLVFINHSDELKIVDNDTEYDGSDFNFPNSEGF
jgi:hypothetical protein